MDNTFVEALVIATAVGTGLVAGLFATFSVLVTPSFDLLPAMNGIRFMQATNRMTIRPLFLFVFLGSIAASAVLAVLAVPQIGGPSGWWVFCGALLFLLGVFVVTAVIHVPRNRRLEQLDPHSSDASAVWPNLLREWTLGNHVRSIASLAALTCYAIALLLS
jgi:uncharacterized membrane protein